MFKLQTIHMQGNLMKQKQKQRQRKSYSTIYHVNSELGILISVYCFILL